MTQNPNDYAGPALALQLIFQFRGFAIEPFRLIVHRDQVIFGLLMAGLWQKTANPDMAYATAINLFCILWQKEAPHTEIEIFGLRFTPKNPLYKEPG